MYSFKYLLTIICLFIAQFLTAQNYQAINGSSFAGSMAAGNNPAAIVHVPFAWDVTPVSIQVKQSTNAVKFSNVSLLASGDTIGFTVLKGTNKRYAFANQDVHLFNTRISLNTKSAIAFGLNVRSYIFATTSRYNWEDSTNSLEDFAKNNVTHSPLSGAAMGSVWAELYGTYAQTIFEDSRSILNAGLSIKVNRSIAGGYGRSPMIDYSKGPQRYSLNNGTIQYGYSANFDKDSAGNNATSFLQNNHYGVSADFGLEYILLSDEDKQEGGEYAYDTKIGISLMNIGRNAYRYGKNSLYAVAKTGVLDTTVENKFYGIGTLQEFTDSLKTITQNSNILSGNFNLYQPARVIINVDKHLVHNYFINAELTIPVLAIIAKNSLYLKDMNLLAITPRWEVKAMGVYLPMLINNQGQFWLGAAVKAGPILLGTHNLANLFTKTSIQNGGFYVALTIRPGKKYNRSDHYAADKTSKQTRNSINCPSL